jgi:putative spermidine/putrescine transport system permease protein
METEQTALGRFSAYLQISPLVLILLTFLIAPMLVILLYSFFKFGPFAMQVGVFTFENYIRSLSFDSVVWSALADTIRTVAITWAITLVLGFVLTYYLVFDVIRLRIKIFLFLLAVVPFWTSGVVRMIAWLPFLGKEGLINGSLMGLGITDEPLQFLLYSDFAVILSYVHVLTLFMVAPLFNVMARIDLRLIEAAKDQGAKGWQILLYIIIPLSRPGIAIGTIFIVALTASDFVAVRLLSGGMSGTLATSVYNQYAQSRYPYSAASGIILLLVLLLFVGGIMRLVDIRKQL